MKRKFFVYLFLFILSLSFVSASQVAYVLRFSSEAEQNVLDSFTEEGLSYDIILADDIDSTDFSSYAILVIGNSYFPSSDREALTDIIPEYRTIVLNNRYYDGSDDDEWGWSYEGGKSTSTIMKNDAPTHTIMEGIDEQWFSYSPATDSYYLLGQKASGIDLLAHVGGHTSSDAIIGTAFPGTVYLNGRVEQTKSVFYGLTESDHWTQDSKDIFKNMLGWILEGIDQDGDGYLVEEDCDDTDPLVYPGADEVAYDYIDQDCDGFDLADVDGDDYCLEGYVIQDVSQCDLDFGVEGSDCDDDVFEINPDAEELIDDIDQNCVNDAPILIGDIPDLNWDEDTSLDVDMDLYFADPDGDDLGYELSLDVDYILLSFLDDIITLTPDPDYFGVQQGTILASDQEFQIPSNTITFTVEDTFDPDLVPPEVILVSPPSGYFSEEDEVAFTFMGEDDVADTLICSFYSDITGVFEALDDNEFTIYNGELKTILVGTEEGIPDGTFVWNIECDDGSNTAFAPSNWGFTVDENDAPVLEEFDDVFVQETELVTIEAIANDADPLDVLIYEIDDPRFTKCGNVFTWQTDYDDGEYFFTVNVTDGELWDDEEVRVVVEDVNRAPEFLGSINNQITDEDVSFDVDLSSYFSDPDGDDLDYSYLNGEHLDVVFNDDIATITPELNWNGQTPITFVCSDGDLSSESNEVVVYVNPINDAPVLENLIDITVNEGGLVDIDPVASDVDYDVLTFYFSAPLDENGEWQTGQDDAGVYEITINVTDGVLWDSDIFTLTVNNVNIDPILDFIDDITVEEDSGQQEVWILSAQDPDGDDGNLVFDIVNAHKSGCSVEGDKLFVDPDGDFFGTTLCEVRVSDLDGGSDSQEVDVTVTGVDDAPEITSYFPLEALVIIDINQVQNFFITWREPDNDPVEVRWFKDGWLVSNGDTYTFLPEGIAKDYSILVEVDDSVTVVDHLWTLRVEEGDVGPEEYTCEELGGIICLANETGVGDVLDASDSDRCYASCVPNEEEPPVTNLTNKKACKNGVIGNLEVSIKEPDDNDEFAPKDIVEIEVEVENYGDEDLDDIIVEAFLLVIDKQNGELDRVEDVESEEIDIDEDDEEDFLLELELPNGDLDEDDEYILFVKAYEDNHEDEQCGEDQIDLDVEREKHDIFIEGFEVSPKSLSCGEELSVTFDLENIGTSEEDDMFITVRIPGLGVEETSGFFTLEEFDEDDNDIKKTVRVGVPGDIALGQYLLEAEVFFDDGDESHVMQETIQISECGGDFVGDFIADLSSDVSIDPTLDKRRGDDIRIPLEIENVGGEFAEFHVVLRNSGFMPTTSQNVLLAGKQSKTLYLESSIREDASFGDHVVNIDIFSEGNLIDQKEVIVRVKQPVEREAPTKFKFTFTLLILSILVLVIIIYFLVVLFKD